jgi:predicted MFS family arabinose efflux permease
MLFDTLSGFCGSLVGGALPGLLALPLRTTLSDPAPYRYSLLIAAVLCLPAVIALARMGGEGEQSQDEGERTAPPGTLPTSLLALMAFVVLLRAAGVGTSRTFFNVYLDDGLGVSTAQIGALFAVVQLAAVPSALVMPVLSERWGNYRVVVWTSLGVAVSMLPLALVPHWAAATLGRIGVYALSSIADPAIGLYQMELVRPRWRSIMAGTSSTALGLSWTALALGGGYLVASLGYRTLFLLAGALTLGGTVLFGIAFRWKERAVPVAAIASRGVPDE